MTNTSYTQFKVFLSRIPSQNLSNTWFIPLHIDKKFPDVPLGTKIKNNPYVKLDVRTCIQRLKQGKNVAIYAMKGGIMFLDLDVENGKIKASQEFINSIPPTLTIKTRNGGLQYYYLNNGAQNQDIFENGKNIGELRTDWQYVVSVGSYVKPDENNFDGDGTYRVISDITINELPNEFYSKIKAMYNTGENDSIKLPERLKKRVMTKDEYINTLKSKGKIYKVLLE